MVKVKIFPASYGDCFLLSINDKEKHINILIDGGFNETYYNYLKNEMLKLKEKQEKLDIVINTHIDSDHIKGLICFLKDNIEENFIEIGDFWFNGLEQIVFDYKPLEEKIRDKDKKIIEDIITKGYEEDFQTTQKINLKESISLSGLLEYGKYNHNKINNSKAITDSLEKIKISENIAIKIIAPNEINLNILKEKWLEELEAKDFHFTFPKNEKFSEAFEYLISRLKFYQRNSIEISSAQNIEFYLNDLKEEDTSVVNSTSIAFVLEYYDKKFLFLGDSIIKEKNYCQIIKNLEKEYKDNLDFELIKLPHHGSKYNISKDFISLVNSKEYIISTNSKKFNHPDIDVLANLILKKGYKTFIFNYEIKQALFIKKEEWEKEYEYDIVIGNGNEILERRYNYEL